MPLESRLFVKTSLVCLVLVALWGMLMSIDEMMSVPIPSMWPIEHAHLAFVGWLLNLVMGIALWFLPLDRERFGQTQGRYPKRAPYFIYGALNGGLLLRFICEPNVSSSHYFALGLGLSALLQTLAILGFISIAWFRTRGASHPAPGVR